MHGILWFSPSKRFRDIALLSLIVVATAIPFLQQPFHMDDAFYMEMARNALQKPLYPNDTAYVFEGKLYPDMGSHGHPPFQAYFLALLQLTFGEGPGKEWKYHAVALVFPLTAVIAFYLLCANFLRKPFRAALLLAFSPLLMVMQHNLMTDVPLLAFWLASVASFIRATETGSRTAYVASSAFQAAAMFTSYQALALTPLLGFYHLRKRKRAAGWAALLLPVVLLAGWFSASCLHYGRFLLTKTAAFVYANNAWFLSKLVVKAAAILQYQGWLIVFPIIIFFIFARSRTGFLAIVAGLILSCAALVAAPQYSAWNKFLLVIGVVGGAVLVVNMTWQAYAAIAGLKRTASAKTINSQFHCLWYFGVMAYCLLMFTVGSARYILPLVPPVLILICRHLENTSDSRRAPSLFRSAAVLYITAALTGALGLALSHADLEFAAIYPRAARDFARVAGRMESYFGGEWGFKYYFNQAGAKLLSPKTGSLPGGSWVVRPRLALPYQLDKNTLEMIVPVQEPKFALANPLRLLDDASPAGFYSTYFGKLPFSFSMAPLEVIDIGQINYLAARLPAARVYSQSGDPPRFARMDIGGKRLAAILVQPGTYITYPLMDLHASEFKLKCGVSPEAYTDGDGCRFDFEVISRDLSGAILTSAALSLLPGIKQADRGWQPVRLGLENRIQNSEYLELRFFSSCKGHQALGAFAEPVMLSPAPDVRCP